MNKDSQDYIATQVYNEYTKARSNKAADDSDFEAVIDMIECQRTEKEYDWMSDVFLPEYASIYNTEASQWANQYFQSRDFVDVYLEGDRPEDPKKSQVIKKLINKTLNHRGLYHFQKYMRARSINSLRGDVYIVTGWVQDVENRKVGTQQIPYEMDVDVYGNPIVSDEQMPAIGTREEDVIRPIVKEDRFEYEVIDPRNVFTDNTYTYSIQDKDWVTIRSERDYSWLKDNEKKFGYFNLDKVKDLQVQSETETSKDSYNKQDKKQKADTKIDYYDVLDRYGLMWAIVKERDKFNNPTKITWGLDDEGNPKSKAELVKTITTVVVSGSQSVVIRFAPTPFVTATGDPYFPLIRGLCYIHPTKDVGMSDGKYSRELQIAINDTINLSNDRVRLATMPTFKGRKYSVEDNDQLYMEPEHIIPLEDVNDLQEIVVRDNIAGALNQTALFIDKLQQVNSVYPTTMGNLPNQASTTATAVAGADARGNQRANYKSLTFEYTFLTELYWHIVQMTHQFMRMETADAVFGQDIKFFDPNADYHYQPISSKIEAEYSKERKISMYDQMIGRLAGLAKVNPAVIPIIGFMIGKQAELMGSDYREVAGMIENLNRTPNNPEKGAQQTGDGQGMMVSNQNGVPMGGMEESVRGFNA